MKVIFSIPFLHCQKSLQCLIFLPYTEQKRCKSEYSEGILWNTTLASTTKEEQCPSLQKGDFKLNID